MWRGRLREPELNKIERGREIGFTQLWRARRGIGRRQSSGRGRERHRGGTFIGLLLDAGPIVAKGQWTPPSPDAVKLVDGRKIDSIGNFFEFAGVSA